MSRGAKDEELCSANGLAFDREAQSARRRGIRKPRFQRQGLLVTPADLLLEAAKVRLELRRNDGGRCGVVEDDVNVSADRTKDRNLDGDPPPRGQLREKRLDHQRLVAVVEARAGARVVAHAELRSQRDAKGDERLKAWARVAGFDPADVGVVEASGATHGRRRYVGVQAEPSQVVGELTPEVSRSTSGLSTDRRWGGRDESFRHDVIKQVRAYVALAAAEGVAVRTDPTRPRLGTAAPGTGAA